MKYFLYRELGAVSQTLPLEFVAGDALSAKQGDLFVVFVPVTHDIVGVYEFQGTQLTLVQKPTKPLTLKDVLKKLSFITHITDTTMRVFKKRFKEISKEDYDAIVNSF